MSAYRANILPILGLMAALVLPGPSLAQKSSSNTPTTQARQPQLDRNGQPLPAGAIARLGTAQFRHQATVTFLGFAGDSNTLLGVGGDLDARLWDLARTKELRRWVVPPPPQTNRFMGNSMPSLALSGNGKMVAFWDGDVVVVKDLASNKEWRGLTRQKLMDQGKIQGQSRGLITLSTDGQMILIEEVDGINVMIAGGGQNQGQGRKVSLWRAATGQMVSLEEGAQGTQVSAFALTPDGKRLALLTQKNQPNIKQNPPKEKGKEKDEDEPVLRLLDATTGKATASLKVAAPTGREMLFLPGGKTLAILHQNNNRVSLHDAASGKELKAFAGAGGEPNGLQVSSDGKRLLIAGTREAVVYEVATGKELRRISLETGNPQPNMFGLKERAVPVALSPDGTTLAVGSKATFRLWDLDSGKERTQAEGSRDFVATLAFAPKGNLLVTGSPDSPLLLWEADTGKILRQFAFPVENEEGPRQNIELPIRMNQVRATFTPDGRLVAGLQRGRTLRRWDAATGKLLPWSKEATRVSNFAYSPDGRTVALSTDNGTVRLADPATGKERLHFSWANVGKQDPQFGGIMAVQTAFTGFTADSRTVIVAGFLLTGGGLDSGVHFIEAATGQARLKFDVKSGMTRGNGQPEIDAIAMALDQVLVAATTSRDGRLLATSGFSNIKVRNLAAGKQSGLFGGQSVVPWTAAFSPDGKWLIAGRTDGGLRVWDLATSAVLADLPLHDVAITALEFSPDGKRLATGSADTTVLVWDWSELRQQVSAKKPAGPLPQLEVLWQDLAGGDAMKAYDAQRVLIAAPTETVPFLKARLKPVSPADQARVEKLLANLDSKQYKTREEAMKELGKLGDLAADAIQKKLAGKLSLEMLQRVAVLHDKLQGPMKAGPLLQARRAIEVLERIGTPEARQVLETMARGAVGHRLTVDAADSVQRLKKGIP